MTTVAGDTTLLQTLERALTPAVGATSPTAAERLVCVTIPAPPVDSVAMFEAAEESGGRALWDQPVERFSLVALGAATEIAAYGEDRLQQLTAAWRHLVAGAVADNAEGCPLAAPIALCGLAFQPADDRSGVWQSYPDALLTVPRFLFITSMGSSWLAASVTVGAHNDGASAVRSTLDDLSALLTRASHPIPDQSPRAVTFAEESDSEWWRRSIAAVEREIRSGAVEKLVLAREVRAHADDPLAWGAVLRRLKDRYAACTTFAFARDGSCFLGSTPERLVRLDGRAVRANCLAGSAPRGETEDEDRAQGYALLQDKKERHEHALVVSALQDALEPCCAALDIPEQPGLLTMPNVQHLHTPVEGTLRDDLHVLDLVARLHPTPAVGGVPQRVASSLIKELEPFDRGWYAGPVGWFDSRGDGEFVVAIRSALLREQDARLYAGCGIVDGSDPEREYAESRLKLEPMLWAMNGGDG
ncbi:MAG: isochorismate synthase [Chloroflexi bacterium]|nr:isochorismate synthase [Chloroflexota bacterium]